MHETGIFNVVLFKAVADDPQNDNYVKCLSSNGVSVSVIPPIDFQFVNISLLADKLANPEKFSGLILSSPRCVKAVQLASDGAIFLAKWAQLPTFVVGETTYSEAVSLGLNCIGQETGNAARLTEFIATKQYSNPLLYPRSNLAADSLETALAKDGIAIDSLDVYQTVPHSRLEDSIDKIVPLLSAKMVFFSPSGMEAVLPLLKLRNASFQETKFYAIGETTEKAMVANGLRVAGKPLKPTPEALLAVLNQS